VKEIKNGIMLIHDDFVKYNESRPTEERMVEIIKEEKDILLDYSNSTLYIPVKVALRNGEYKKSQ
jgi:hypothetical protein